MQRLVKWIREIFRADQADQADSDQADYSYEGAYKREQIHYTVAQSQGSK